MNDLVKLKMLVDSIREYLFARARDRLSVSKSDSINVSELKRSALGKSDLFCKLLKKLNFYSQNA